MKLEGKKKLAARTFDVGTDRIVFNNERLAEIKEAITKQDIRDLAQSGAIHVKEIKGQRKNERSRSRRRAGSIRKKVRDRKGEYVMFVRKLRAYLAELKKQEVITAKETLQLRKELRSRHIKTKAQLKERIAHIKKQ